MKDVIADGWEKRGYPDLAQLFRDGQQEEYEKLRRKYRFGWLGYSTLTQAFSVPVEWSASQDIEMFQLLDKYGDRRRPINNP